MTCSTSVCQRHKWGGPPFGSHLSALVPTCTQYGENHALLDEFAYRRERSRPIFSTQRNIGGVEIRSHDVSQSFRVLLQKMRNYRERRRSRQGERAYDAAARGAHITAPWGFVAPDRCKHSATRIGAGTSSASCANRQSHPTSSVKSLKAHKTGERGFSLMLIALSVFVMIGMLGLAIDMGRIFIYKSELQTFADNSAMGAIAKMDGSQSGIQGANAMALTGPGGAALANKVNFDSTTISTVNTSYATSFAGTYDSYATASTPVANNYRFLKVTASADVNLNFLPILPGISTAYTVSASATSGQMALSSLTNGGLLPFSPDAHNQADTVNFGLTPGTQYALKWPKSGSSPCNGDTGFIVPGSPPSEHGFVDIGEGNANSRVRDAIISGGYPNANSNPSSIATGDTLGGVPGNRGSSIFGALDTRASQDTDDLSTTYPQYKAGGAGNGRRVVTVAIGGSWSGNGNNANTPILGFANFFLNTSYSGSSGGICATYIGPANINGAGSGGTDSTKIYTNVLYQ